MLCLLLGSACWCVNHFDKGAPILRVYVELKHGTCDVQPDTQPMGCQNHAKLSGNIKNKLILALALLQARIQT